MSEHRRVVVTGLGIVSPLGFETAGVWEALRAGRSGIARISAFDPGGLPSQIAGEVCGYDARKFVSPKQRKALKVMCRDTLMAIGAANIALRDAGLLDYPRLDRERAGVVFGATMMSSELEELVEAAVEAHDEHGQFSMKLWGERSIQRMPPLWMLKYLPNMPACHISILYDLQGPNNTITMEEAASPLAIGEALNIIRRGDADVMIAGGAESNIHPLRMARLCLLGDVSVRNDVPEQACRPFDREHNGVVAGEGAAALVLEAEEHALARGARIYAELAGFGAACITSADMSWRVAPAALVAAMRAALEDARANLDSIGFINPHGCASVAADRVEAAALHELFGAAASRLPVVPFKSHFGSAGTACGALELVAGLLALHNRELPPSAAFREPDPECNLRVVHGGPERLERGAFLKLNFNRVGQAAALVVRSYEQG